ncbi:MAG: winged helix-turn-helix domain-containing protein [Sulfolobales archaeon]
MAYRSSCRGGGLYSVYKISIVLFLLATLFSLSTLYSQEGSRVLVVVGGDGVVDVAITLYPSQPGEEIIYIDLPVKPLPGSIVVSPIDVIPQLLSNDTLALLKPSGVQRIDISYVASISVSGGVLSTLIKYPQWVGNLTVRIHRNVIPITMPDNISSIRTFGDYVIIEMARNTTWNLQYVLAPQQITSTSAPPIQQQGVQPPQQNPQMWALLPLAAGVAAAGAAGAAAYAIIARRRRGDISEYLDNVDKEILSIVEKLGEATARDIMDATRLPKTTLYRRLNKMIKMGIIGTRAKGGVTYYYIIKK